MKKKNEKKKKIEKYGLADTKRRGLISIHVTNILEKIIESELQFKKKK